MEPPWPLMDEDGDWFALSGDLTRHEAASDLAYNLIDWWVDDFITFDDDDNCHGWVTGFRALLTDLKRGFLRPQSRNEDGELYQGDEDRDFWWQTDEQHPRAVPAWIWQN